MNSSDSKTSVPKEIFNGLSVLILCIGLSGRGEAESSLTAIFYPARMPKPPSLYSAILSGLEKAQEPALLFEFPVTEHENLQPYLNGLQPHQVIALSKSAALSLSHSAYRDKTIVSALYFNASEFKGVSLALDSRILSQKIQTLAPFIKRVWVVQGTAYQTVDLYPSDANALTFLVEHGRSDDPTFTIQRLMRLIEHVALPTDAILVPPNIPDELFYEIGKTAWDKKIILLSTRLSHLDSGAFMVIQPDYPGLGQQISQFNSKVGYESLQQVRLSLNRKVAEHFNLALDPQRLTPLAVDVK